MKTTTQVINENPDKKTLINAVINRVGKDYVEDINSYGMAGGFAGFIYYTDTHRFAMRHRKAIIQWLEEDAEEIGEDIPTMVSHFGFFKNGGMDKDDKRELYTYLGGGKCEQSGITNLMAWYAAENVCRLFED